MSHSTSFATLRQPLLFLGTLLKATARWYWNALLFRPFRVLQLDLSDPVVINGNTVLLRWSVCGHGWLWVQGAGMSTAAQGMVPLPVQDNGTVIITFYHGFKRHHVRLQPVVYEVHLLHPMFPVSRLRPIKFPGVILPHHSPLRHVQYDRQALEPVSSPLSALEMNEDFLVHTPHFKRLAMDMKPGEELHKQLKAIA